MDYPQVRQLLRRNQETQSWSLDELGRVTDWLRERIFSRPAITWSEEDVALAKLWVTAANNRQKCTAHIRWRLHKSFKFAVTAGTAEEGFNQGFATFFDERFLSYDPTREERDGDKEKLFMIYFRRSILNATFDYIAKERRQPRWDRPASSGDDDEPVAPEIEDPTQEPYKIVAAHEFAECVDALVERSLASPEAKQAMARLSGGATAKETRQWLALTPGQLGEIRYATIIKMTVDEALKRVKPGEDDEFGVLYQRIAAAVGTSYEGVRVYVSRARDWVFTQCGSPSLD
jgi:hypothetical protein